MPYLDGYISVRRFLTYYVADTIEDGVKLRDIIGSGRFHHKDYDRVLVLVSRWGFGLAVLDVGERAKLSNQEEEY